MSSTSMLQEGSTPPRRGKTEKIRNVHNEALKGEDPEAQKSVGEENGKGARFARRRV